MAFTKWTMALALISFFAVLHNSTPTHGQLLKLPRLRWPSFNRNNKKDSPIELKGSATSQEPSVTHVYAGANGGPPGPPPPGPPPLGPPLSAGHPSSLPPHSMYGSAYSPFGPFGRSPFIRPANSFVFPNIVAPPPPPPPMPPSPSYYSSAPSSGGGRKNRRRRPVYDNDSMEDASTEDEPVYIKVKPRKRRPIVIDEEELLGRNQNGGSSEESDDAQPKFSYKGSRSKPQVVYVDSSREYQSPNERRMVIKNEEMVQDAPSFHHPSISALHASVASGGYQLESRLPPSRSSDGVLFMNDIENANGPSYHIDGHGDQSDFSNHFLLRQLEQHRHLSGVSSPGKGFRIPESSTPTPTIRIVLNSLNSNPDQGQMNRQMPPATTPNPLQFSRAQIPAPLPQNAQPNAAQSMNHFHIYEPTTSIFHQQQSSPKTQTFPFGLPQTQALAWPQAGPPTNFHHSPAPTPSPATKQSSIKVARRSFSNTFPMTVPIQANQDHRFFGFAHQQAPTQSYSRKHLPTLITQQISHQTPLQEHPTFPRPQSPQQPQEETIFIEKNHGKAPAFASTETPPLSAAQAQKNQQYIDFSCATRRSGYYANRMYKCQIYHQCSKRVLTQTFMCPNGTAFSEKQKLCERIDKVACVAEESSIRGTRLRSATSQQTPQQVTEQPPQISSRADILGQDIESSDSTTVPGATAPSESTSVSTPSSTQQAKFSTSVSYHVSSSTSSTS